MACFFCTIICIIAIYCLYRVSTIFSLEFVLYRLFVHIYCSHCLIKLFMFIIFVNVKHDETTNNSFTLGLFWGMILSNLGQGTRHLINFSFNLVCKKMYIYIYICLFSGMHVNVMLSPLCP